MPASVKQKSRRVDPENADFYHGLNNNKLRVIARRAYGFHSPGALISMLFLCCGGIELAPPLPHTHLRRFIIVAKRQSS